MPAHTYISDWLGHSAQRHPDKTALVCGQQRLTYRQLDERSTKVAEFLVSRGMERGERALVYMNNCAESIIAAYGIAKGGGVFVVLDSSAKQSTLRYVLTDAGARILFTQRSKMGVVRDVSREAGFEGTVVCVGESPETLGGEASCTWEAVLAGGAPRKSVNIDSRSERDLAALIYTSGSTGRPKGVMSTHGNMAAAAQSIIAYLKNSENDIILSAIPLSFDYGLYQAVMTFMFGGTLVLERSFAFPQEILRRIAEEKVTGFPVVPTMTALLMRYANFRHADLSSVRYITSTGAHFPRSHIRALREYFPHVAVYSMFGLTECKRVSYVPPQRLGEKIDSVGIPMPSCEVRIVDENGRAVGPGQVGELMVRGPNVMQGYWNDPELTSRVFSTAGDPPQRELHTGDYVYADEEGFLFFVGRRDDIFKCRGERVGAREVEDVIVSMPGVSEAAVIGVPDEILGAAVTAYVVPDRHGHPDAQSVQRFCAARLESFKCPRQVFIRAALPKTPHGKVDKRTLAHEAQSQEAHADGDGPECRRSRTA